MSQLNETKEFTEDYYEEKALRATNENERTILEVIREGITYGIYCMVDLAPVISIKILYYITLLMPYFISIVRTIFMER